MAAYGALTSLLQTLNDIIIHTPHLEFESLRDKVSLLLDSLDRSPNSSLDSKLEQEIRDTARAAEDLIESQISNQLLLSQSETLKDDNYHEFRHIMPLIKKMAPALFFCAPKEEVVSENELFWDKQLLSAFQDWICALTHLVQGGRGYKKFVIEEDSIDPSDQSCKEDNVFDYSKGYHAYEFFSLLKNFRMLGDRELDQQVMEVIDFITDMTKSEVIYSFENSYWENWEMLSASWDVVTALRHKLLVPRGEALMVEFDSITKRLIKLNDVCASGAEDPPTSRNILPPASSSKVHGGASGRNVVVVGFEGDLAAIQTQLLTDSSKVEIVSIVGMGGIGKTTLARKIYADPCVVGHFDVCAWATVSQEYSVRQILLGLLACTERHHNDMDKESNGKLALYLHRSLKGRRYLIVMDDLWDVEVWDEVNRSLPDDYNGSRVLLTTRLEDVAVHAKSCSPIHKMRFLGSDDCWNLLSEKVFAAEECPLELREIGKEIANNCGGLPLAIVVAGGLLSNVSRTPLCWRDVADNLISLVSKDDEKCLEILSLSYNRLPHHLKVCFLYLGIFPEDFEFPVSKLIRLWAAEGMLRQHISKSMELVAEEYLEDLIQRSLISVCSWTRSGKVKTCRMHDLLRELCLRNAEKENVFHAVKHNSGVSRNFINTRHRLCIHPSARITENKFSSMLSTRSGVRSILCTGRHLQSLTNIHLPFRLLRVLDVVILHFSSFPEDITELVNLRYLGLTLDRALPPSILKLWNLQTIVQHCRTIRSPELPIQIWLMPKLRHLCFTSACIPKSFDTEFFFNNVVHLESLETLMLVKDFVCRDYIVKRIPNLNKLGISYDGFAFKGQSYQFENLVYLHQLETLKISVINPLFNFMPDAKKLAFPLKLKNLTLRGCRIPWKYMTRIGALPNLEVLKLRRNAFHGGEWEPVEGEFLKLKFLLIEETNLMDWRADDTHFPSLKHLIIRSCSRIEIPSRIGDISTLQMIELFGCGPSAVNSAKKIQEEQQDLGNNFLEVRVDSRQSNNSNKSRIVR